MSGTSKFKTVTFPDLNASTTGVTKAKETAAKPEAFKVDKKIHEKGQGDYASVRSKYGPLATTDPERTPKTKKDSRFVLNPIIHSALAIDKEEQRVIEERVKTMVKDVEEKARKDAFESGYKDGLKKGHDEAFKKFQQEASERLKGFEEMVESFEGAKQGIFEANEHFIIELIHKVAKAVVLKELATDDEYITRLARELVDRTGVRENIRVRLHPQDHETLTMLKEELEKGLGALKNLSIEASPQVPQGGCTVETEWSVIEASLEGQLDGIIQALHTETQQTQAEGEAEVEGEPTSGDSESEPGTET